jgi:hypothetical protein
MGSTLWQAPIRQTRCEAGTESHGSLSEEMAGLPGEGSAAFFCRAGPPVLKAIDLCIILPKLEITMKRGILLILAVLLLLDLSDEGFLGEAKFVPPSFSKISLTFPQDFDLDIVDTPFAPPSSVRWEIYPLQQFQAVLIGVQTTLKIIIFCNNGSSGGIPL